jgi:hypothetical protein
MSRRGDAIEIRPGPRWSHTSSPSGIADGEIPERVEARERSSPGNISSPCLRKARWTSPNREGHNLVNESAGGPDSCEGSRRDTRQGETRIYAAGRQWLDPTRCPHGGRNHRPANEAMDLSHEARGDMKRDLLLFVEVPAGRRRSAIIGWLGAINPPKGASECAPVFVASIVSDLIDGKSTRP